MNNINLYNQNGDPNSLQVSNIQNIPSGDFEIVLGAHPVLIKNITQDEEFDLINSSNSIVLGLSDNNSDKQNYLDYLNLVNQIKVNVKNDFNN